MSQRLMHEAGKLEGWDALDMEHPVLQNLKREQHAEILELAELVQTVFSTAPGRALLERWIQSYLARPVAHAGVDMIHVGIREGENSFVRQILHLIKVAEEGIPQ